MVAQWISAAAARAVLAEQSYDDAAEKALIARAHAGLVNTNALRIDMADGKTAAGPIPVEFWWPEGMWSLVQDWAIGDMRNRIKGRDCRAYGVQFDLDGVKQMLPAARVATIARQFSVAGDPDWITAQAALAFMYGDAHAQPALAGGLLADECRLGFVAARAVLMRRADDGERPDDWTVEAREWDIPSWFWQDFTSEGSSSQDWDRGVFSGKGSRGGKSAWVTLTGVYFLRDSLACFAPSTTEQAVAEASSKGGPGRRREYDWDGALIYLIGQAELNGIAPDPEAHGVQADLIKLLADWFSLNGGKVPADSQLQTWAKRVLASIRSATT
jgi:hypothetical protein